MAKCLVLFAFVSVCLEAASGQVTTFVRPDPRTGRLVRAVRIMSSEIKPMLARKGSAEAERVYRIIDDAAQRHQVDPLLVHSIVSVESAYNPVALSHKGAQGLMQLMPDTARRHGVTDSFNVVENIEGGVKYLRWLQDRFQNDRLAIAAYNAGENAVFKYSGVPPYAETRQYVERVTKRWNDSKQRAALRQPRSTETIRQPATAEPVLRGLRVETGEDGRVYLSTRE